MKKNKQLIVNLYQTQEFTGNHHIGVKVPEKELGMENPRMVRENDEIRQIFAFYPRDHVESGKGDEIQEVSVKEGYFVQFPAGSRFSPRPVTWLLPDNFEELPSSVKNNEFTSEFLAHFYRMNEKAEALEILAEGIDDIEKIKELTQSELDEERLDQVIKTVKSIDNITGSRSGSSDK